MRKKSSKISYKNKESKDYRYRLCTVALNRDGTRGGQGVYNPHVWEPWPNLELEYL